MLIKASLNTCFIVLNTYIMINTWTSAWMLFLAPTLPHAAKQSSYHIILHKKLRHWVFFLVLYDNQQIPRGGSTRWWGEVRTLRWERREPTLEWAKGVGICRETIPLGNCAEGGGIPQRGVFMGGARAIDFLLVVLTVPPLRKNNVNVSWWYCCQAV